MSETSISVSNKPGKQRPLSPHLSHYKPQMTSMMSIAHRISGIFLTLGLALFSWAIIALAQGEQAFQAVQDSIASWPGQIVQVGATFALFFHVGTGVRHLFWDIGKGFSIEATYRSSYAVLVFTLIATTLFWVFSHPDTVMNL